MLLDCSLQRDNFQELPRFNRERAEKCCIEKGQPYQPKPVMVETVDPNKRLPLIRGLRPFSRDSNDNALAATLDDKNNKTKKNYFVHCHSTWR